MKPSDSLTIHGRTYPAPDSDVKFCLNCDADAMRFYLDDDGEMHFLCQSCAEAFELGQTYPNSGVFYIGEEGDSDEFADEDAE